MLEVGVIRHIFRRRRKLSERTVTPPAVPRLSFVVVNAEQAKIEPYLFVYVNNDGSARELHPNERNYLETPFDPFDGNRPYIKDSYLSKNGWGEIGGFLKRAELPSRTPIALAPSEDPCKPLSKQDQIQILRNRGFEVMAESDRVFTLKRPNR